MKARTMYMHTIDSKPAFWSDESEQIVYADVARFSGDGTRSVAVLRRTLRQIRRDQQRSIRNRRGWGMGEGPGKYGYCRVEVPA
jgi:hypothetical protein